MYYYCYYFLSSSSSLAGVRIVRLSSQHQPRNIANEVKRVRTPHSLVVRRESCVSGGGFCAVPTNLIDNKSVTIFYKITMKI